MKKLKRCNRTGLVILNDELQAKLVLAQRVWKDKGEKRYFECPLGHFHLSRETEEEYLRHGKRMP